jgi:hypothetical protein
LRLLTVARAYDEIGNGSPVNVPKLAKALGVDQSRY